MKWAEMTPEQRNALVAEKIMGWTPQLCEEHQDIIHYDSGDAECAICGAGGFGDNFKHNIIPPPRYSEEMNDAMLVIKKMRNDHGCLWRISIEPYISPPNMVTLATRSREVSCQGAFLAATICLVALKFLGVEIES